jgi:dephospho-CoA kinase
MAMRASAVDAAYCVLAIPLLAEGGRYPFIDCVVVVDVDPDVQRERVMRRDGVAAELALKMIAAQASRAERLAIADLVVDNSGTVGDLKLRVDRLHEELLQRAARHRTDSAG